MSSPAMIRGQRHAWNLMKCSGENSAIARTPTPTNSASPTDAWPPAEGMGILKIGRTVGVGTSVVQRVFKQEQLPAS